MGTVDTEWFCGWVEKNGLGLPDEKLSFYEYPVDSKTGSI